MKFPGSNSLLIALCLLTAHGLHAQGLPALQQFEVENVRLVLLDKDGNRQGTLEGKRAAKKRDGRVEITDAVLAMTRGDQRTVLRAAEFLYQPDTEAFDCPKGMTGELPDGGTFDLPQAAGTITIGPAPKLVVRATGTAKFASADPLRALLRAEMVDPEMELSLGKGSPSPGLSRLKLTGRRGGEFRVRVESVPVPDGGGARPGALILGSFGDMTADFDTDTGRGTIGLLRRARMALEPGDQPASGMEVTANRIDLRGVLIEGAPSDLASRLTGLEIDAAGTVHLTGPSVRGFGDVLSYREPSGLRVVTLSGSPSVDVEQVERDTPGLLRMRSRRIISLVAPLTPPNEVPAWLELRVEAGAQVWREAQGRVAWRISGRVVDVRSSVVVRPPGPFADAPQARREMFRVIVEGYSPLLRVAGAATLTDQLDDPGQRAAIFGTSATGQFEGDQLQSEVRGPGILAMLYADQGLADELRYALGLARRPDSPLPRPGRLTVRAQQVARISVSTLPASATAARPLWIDAQGEVELEHTPLPRFDRDLVTFTGDSAGISLRGNRVERAALSGAGCLATLGPDLLISDGFRVVSTGPLLEGLIRGPGRLVVRDPQSLAYFRRAVERMPRRGLQIEPAVPDAGWMNFGGDVLVAGDEDTRAMDVSGGVELRMVLGEFETPRAGPSGQKDLPELEDADVQQLYLVRGRSLLVFSSGHAAKPPAVLNLLRLEGNALIRSQTDRLQVTALDSIEATGADDQRTAGNPLTVVLLGSPVLALEDAGLFFGDVVRRGAFDYDGAWRLEAGQRLELTFRPLAAGDPDSVRGIRQALEVVERGQAAAPMMLEAAWRARTRLELLVKDLPPVFTPEAEGPRKALAAALAAESELRLVVARETGVCSDINGRRRASRQAARAARLMAGLVEVAGSGGVRGRFEAAGGSTPALQLGVTTVLVTFDGLGEIVDTAAEGPVTISRGDYTISGRRLSQARDGTLILDGAAIELPDNTGVSVTGVRTVSLRQRGNPESTPGATRTMITRITGENLRVRVKLSREEMTPAPK
ncbi:MAG: hypothetical protein KF754_02495 [Planctomycetes bacterium]|nr:hypothetical protein [Planctomycetota bacterium]